MEKAFLEERMRPVSLVYAVLRDNLSALPVPSVTGTFCYCPPIVLCVSRAKYYPTGSSDILLQFAFPVQMVEPLEGLPIFCMFALLLAVEVNVRLLRVAGNLCFGSAVRLALHYPWDHNILVV